MKVNDNASVCPDFLKGKCPRGKTCEMKHQLEQKISKERNDNKINENINGKQDIVPNSEIHGQVDAKFTRQSLIPSFLLESPVK